MRIKNKRILDKILFYVDKECFSRWASLKHVGLKIEGEKLLCNLDFEVMPSRSFYLPFDMEGVKRVLMQNINA